LTELSEDLKVFLRQNEHADVNELLLKQKTILGYSSSFVADQLLARRKMKIKVPSMYSNLDVIYPPSLNLEQSSSEETAKFKTEWIAELIDTRHRGCDLTGGFGVDSLFMSRIFEKYLLIEPNPELIALTEKNHKLFDVRNISYRNTYAESFVKETEKLDFIYLDPSRRSKTNQKVFSLTQCEPDITTLQNDLFQKSNYVLIKASPLLDLQVAIKELKHIKLITVLSVHNECKEVLFFCDTGFTGEIVVNTVNLQNEKQDFSFKFSEERAAEPEYSEAKEYLYEPNASILKAGGFKSIAVAMSLPKLHKSTHLYTSSELRPDFPGRIFRVEAQVKPEKKMLEKFFPDGKANVTTRNYPLTPDQLRKKTQLKDGGNKYLFGFTDIKNKLLVSAERLK